MYCRSHDSHVDCERRIGAGQRLRLDDRVLPAAESGEHVEKVRPLTGLVRDAGARQPVDLQLVVAALALHPALQGRRCQLDDSPGLVPREVHVVEEAEVIADVKVTVRRSCSQFLRLQLADYNC